MNALEVSQRSTDAWNRHDADALVALYAEGGTYHNPRLDHALTGQAIGDFAKSVWAAYPDSRSKSSVEGTPEEGAAILSADSRLGALNLSRRPKLPEADNQHPGTD